MQVSELVELLIETTSAIRAGLAGLEDWGLSGQRATQYHSDVRADAIALEHLLGAGLSVLSEESGFSEGGELLAVLDPLDGSTNASRGLPWWATSICVLDAEGPLAAVVVNQVSGVTYDAIRSGGARRDGMAIVPSSATRLSDSLVALSGFPARALGWKQYRAYGAAALDLCAVADGTFDAYLDCVPASHGPWDYLGGLLVCREAGAVVEEADGLDLIARGHEDRRSPVAAATRELTEELLAAFHAVGPARAG
jgi:fructose-1,6-bisphosphatase/inositol monophosphatase family enzyme